MSLCYFTLKLMACLAECDLLFFLPHLLHHTHTHLQVNKRGRVQHRAILISDNYMFKLDPNKSYQRKKSPIPLQEVHGVSVTPDNNQGFIIHLRGGSDLLCYIISPNGESRVPELCAVLYQTCQRLVKPFMIHCRH